MWFQQLQARFLQYDTPLVLPPLFRGNILTVNAALNESSDLPFGRRTYKYAGRLTPIFNRPDIGIHRGKSRKLYLGKYQIEFDNPLNYEFALELLIHLWTPQLDLTIWQSDEEPEQVTATDLLFIESGIARVESKIDLIKDSVPESSGQ